MARECDRGREGAVKGLNILLCNQSAGVAPTYTQMPRSWEVDLGICV
ncbi:hypothetical protein EV647_0569 [Kribbella sp. VKM Ac-2566]|nr:hypothetical protein EV647_0569 [Kribbella sp. VKM Ac-2566]